MDKKFEILIKVISRVMMSNIDNSVTVEAIKSRKRDDILVEARQIFCYIAFIILIPKEPVIAAYLKLNKSTVYYSVRIVEGLINVDRKFAQRFSIIENEFKRELSENSLTMRIKKIAYKLDITNFEQVKIELLELAKEIE